MAIKVPYSVINNAVFNVCDKRRRCPLYFDDYDHVDDDFMKDMLYETRDYFLSHPEVVKSVLSDLELALSYDENKEGFVEGIKDLLLYTLEQSDCLQQINRALKDYRDDLTAQQKDLDHDRFQSL